MKQNMALLFTGIILIAILISPGCTAPSPANVTATPTATPQSTITPAGNPPAPKPTPAINCTQCHPVLSNRQGHESSNQNCTTCHTAQETHLKHQNATGVNCMSCHGKGSF